MFFAHSTPVIAFLETYDWDLNKAFSGLISIARKRHDDPTTDVKLTDFPRDYHDLGALLPNLTDKNGRPVLWVRSIDPPEMFYPQVMRMSAWVTDRFCERVSSCHMKPGLVFDCQVMTTSLRLLKDIITMLLQRCPPWIEYIAVAGLGPYFRFFARLVRAFLPRYLKDSLTFIDIDDLPNLFELKDLPVYLGGEVKLLSDSDMDKCPSLTEYSKILGVDPIIFEKWRENVHTKYAKYSKANKLKAIDMIEQSA